MPRRDTTGPMGAGPMTGRGLGACSGGKAIKYGAGLGLGLGMGFACRRGFGRGFFAGQQNFNQPKELLQHKKSRLQAEIEAIDKQLDAL